jgi:hypothetical protein
MAVAWGRVDLLRPDPDVFRDFAAIAQVLSRINRWNGHTWTPWSVLAHSVVAAWLVPPRWRLTALVHDAHEAICGDLCRPLRDVLPDFLTIERSWKLAAATRWDVDPTPQSEAVTRVIDAHLAATEARDLLRRPNAESQQLGGASPLPLSLRSPGIMAFDASPHRWTDAWCAVASQDEDRLDDWHEATEVLSESAKFHLEASRRIVEESIRSALEGLS